MKKGLSLILSAVLLTTGMGVGSFIPTLVTETNVSAESNLKEYNGFQYVSNGSEITISGFTSECDIYNLVIPDSIDGLPVTRIKERSFTGINTFKTIDLGRNVTMIEFDAFTYSPNLKQITLPDNLKTFPTYSLTSVFGSDSTPNSGHPCSFEKIIIPKTVKYISEDFLNPIARSGNNSSNALGNLLEYQVDDENPYFSDIDGVLYSKDQTKLIKYPNGKGITKFTVPDTVTQIKEDAFYKVRFTNIEYFDLGKNTMYLDKNSIVDILPWVEEFKLSHDLIDMGDELVNFKFRYKKLFISDSVTSIPNIFYYNASDLEDIVVDEGNNQYFSDSGVLYNKTDLVKCPPKKDIRTYDVKDKTKTIYADAFTETNIDSITIPASVEKIYSTAFYNSTLKRIKGYADTEAEVFAYNNKYEFINLGVVPPETNYNFDVNGDGIVNVVDLMLLINHLLGK